MKYSIKFTISLVCTLIFSFAAQAQNSKWIRVQSDNGEFSIEVPAEYGFFADKDGFLVSENFNSYALKEMNMFNAYSEKTLISFESYKATKAALEAMREKDARNGKSSEIKSGDFKIKQVVLETKDSYAVKRYFSSKNYIYVLTAAARNGETPAMKRFLDSLVFTPDAKVPDTTPKAIAFSALKATPIEVEAKLNQPAPETNKPVQPTLPTTADNISKLVIVSKPPVSYTEAAKKNMEQGKIAMRITFSKEGRVSKLSVLQTLQDGLLRQAVFAAMRIKFLPQEKNGEPVTVTKIIEYGFRIY